MLPYCIDIFADYANRFSLLPHILILLALWESYFNRNWKSVIWATLSIVFVAMTGDYLKYFFKVPAIFGKCPYGFPSGHMYLFTALYGWIWYRIKATTQISIFADIIYFPLMALIAYYCVIHGYHTWTDVLGGYFFGTLALYGIIKITQQDQSLIS